MSLDELTVSKKKAVEVLRLGIKYENLLYAMILDAFA
jgi:hypothetical protein